MECEACGNLLGKKALPMRNFQHTKCFVNMARLEGPAAVNRELFPGDDVWVEGDVTGVGVLTQNEEFAAIARKFDAFVDRFGEADALDDQVGPETAGFGQNEGTSVFNGGGGGDIDEDIRSKGPSHFEAMGRAADGNHFPGSALLGDGEGGEADRARALHDDGIAPGDGAAFQAVDRGHEGATGSDDGFSRNRIRNFEQRRAGAEVDLFGVAAAEVGGGVAAVGDAIRLAGDAAGGLADDPAVVAFPAGDGAGPDDTITNGEGFATEVLDEALAEQFDAANRFMAHDDGQGDGKLAEPEVDVGAADTGHFDADEAFAGAGGGERWELADF